MSKPASQVTFEIFEKDILPNKIVDSLLNLIKDKQLLPGDKLPAERDLARLMNVGRPSLREALRALSVMNVIEIRPGSGAFVSALQPEQLVQHLDFVFALDDSSIFQLIDARRTLELRTVALAAAQITSGEIGQLETYLDRMRRNAGDQDICNEADREFHKTIALAAGNPILYKFVAVLNQLATRSRCQSYTLPHALVDTFDEHQAIIDALKTGNPELARQAMLHHLNQAELHLRQLLQSRTSSLSETRTAQTPGANNSH